MRVKQLDLFRALAILLVIAHHYGQTVPDMPLGLNYVVGAIFIRGWIGVDLFFVISGFLIAGLLFSEFKATHNLDVRRFFVRRGFKIYPAFYVLLLCTFFVGWMTHERGARSAFLFESLFLQNYGPGLWVHTWSLGIEEQFYLTLPFALCFLASMTGGLPRLYRNRFWLIACLLLLSPLPAIAVGRFGLAQDKVTFNLFAAAIACWLIIGWGILVRVLTSRRGEGNPFYYLPHSFFFVALLSLSLRAVTAWYLIPWESKSHSFPSHLHMDSLMFGVMLAYLHHFRGEWLKAFVQRNHKTMALGVISLAVALFTFRIETSFFFQVFGFTILYLMFGGGLLLSLYVWTGKFQSNPMFRGLTYIGFYSYSIYLWHVPLLAWVFSRILQPNPSPARYLLGLVAYVLSSLALGIIMARLIEQPALRLRDKLFPSRTKSAPLMAPPTVPETMPRDLSQGGESVLSFGPPIGARSSELGEL
jgi:peptidoglycan/LPS O-acetylase OafA/YrhL